MPNIISNLIETAFYTSVYIELRYTHYYNSNLIWRTVSRRVDEVISSVIQWYDLIHET